MMLSPTLKLTMDETSREHCVIEDVANRSARWLIGMSDAGKVVHLLDSALRQRAVAVQGGQLTRRVDVPVDAFVLLAAALGYYQGIGRRDDDTDSRTGVTMLGHGLMVEMDELAGDHCTVTDMAGDTRWVIGMEDIPDVIRLLDTELRSRSAGVQAGPRGGVQIPIDGFVVFAETLGYYLGLSWREADSGIKRPSLPEFAYIAGIPLLARLDAGGSAN